MEILVTIATELAKGFMGEAGKAGAKALFTRAEQTQPAEPIAEYDPLIEAEEAANSFLSAVAHGDRDVAWEWCDPAWADDPERSQSLTDTLQAAPPLNWTIKSLHVPDDWIEGEWLPWVALETIVTFDLGDGSYPVIPAMIWTVETDYGWRVADIAWDSAFYGTSELENVFELLPSKQVIQCSRCPQKLSVPVGIGRIRVKCPSCWTRTVIDT